MATQQTPQAEQAHAYRTQQAERAAMGAVAVAGLLQARRPWASVLSLFARYQLAAATAGVTAMARWVGHEEPNTDPSLFAGVSSAGFAISEPLIATIDERVPAPAAAIPDPWWQRSEAAKFIRATQQLIESEILDAARSAAQAELVTATSHQNYVRVLRAPSCKRCVVLAGRIYHDLEGFERHPGCDCEHYPVRDWDEAESLGLAMSPEDAYEKGYIRDLTQAERRAIEDGADITTVINSSSGIYTADIFGRRLKATRYGTTRRAKWRKEHPSTPVRLRPESIYRIVDQEYGGDRDEALRLLKLYGYLK